MLFTAGGEGPGVPYGGVEAISTCLMACAPLSDPIGQREGLQALVVSAKRSEAESIALVSSLGVAPRWAKTLWARTALPANRRPERPGVEVDSAGLPAATL